MNILKTDFEKGGSKADDESVGVRGETLVSSWFLSCIKLSNFVTILIINLYCGLFVVHLVVQVLGCVVCWELSIVRQCNKHRKTCKTKVQRFLFTFQKIRA